MVNRREQCHHKIKEVTLDMSLSIQAPLLSCMTPPTSAALHPHTPNVFLGIKYNSNIHGTDAAFNILHLTPHTGP